MPTEGVLVHSTKYQNVSGVEYESVQKQSKIEITYISDSVLKFNVNFTKTITSTSHSRIECKIFVKLILNLTAETDVLSYHCKCSPMMVRINTNLIFERLEFLMSSTKKSSTSVVSDKQANFSAIISHKTF